MHSNHSSPQTLADRLVFGFTATLPGAGRPLLRRLDSYLSNVGDVTTPSTRSSEGYTQVTLHLLTDDGRPAGEMRIDLHVHLVGKDLVFGNRCSIQCNGLTMMRGVLGLPPDLTSFDGKSNQIGSENHTHQMLRLQLQHLGEAAQYVLDALQSAFGEDWKPGKLWLKAGEACRDYHSANALADIRIVHHATMSGTLERRWDEYRRLSSEEHGGVSTLRFISHASGPEDKLYAKNQTVRRAETCCPSRRKVTKLTGVKSEDFSAEGLQRLSLHFLTAASARLDLLERHVAGALDGEVSSVDLITVLRPLIERAWGDGKGRGPFSVEAAETAKAALDAFLSVGFFDAGGLHSRHAIRRDLSGLASPDGPLSKHERRAVYYLKPRFARACAAVRFEHRAGQRTI